jgi:hypothetical protein
MALFNTNAKIYENVIREPLLTNFRRGPLNDQLSCHRLDRVVPRQRLIGGPSSIINVKSEI